MVIFKRSPATFLFIFVFVCVHLSHGSPLRTEQRYTFQESGSDVPFVGEHMIRIRDSNGHEHNRGPQIDSPSYLMSFNPENSHDTLHKDPTTQQGGFGGYLNPNSHDQKFGRQFNPDILSLFSGLDHHFQQNIQQPHSFDRIHQSAQLADIPAAILNKYGVEQPREEFHSVPFGVGAEAIRQLVARNYLRGLQRGSAPDENPLGYDSPGVTPRNGLLQFHSNNNQNQNYLPGLHSGSAPDVNRLGYDTPGVTSRHGLLPFPTNNNRNQNFVNPPPRRNQQLQTNLNRLLVNNQPQGLKNHNFIPPGGNQLQRPPALNGLLPNNQAPGLLNFPAGGNNVQAPPQNPAASRVLAQLALGNVNLRNDDQQDARLQEVKRDAAGSADTSVIIGQYDQSKGGADLTNVNEYLFGDGVVFRK